MMSVVVIFVTMRAVRMTVGIVSTMIGSVVNCAIVVYSGMLVIGTCLVGLVGHYIAVLVVSFSALLRYA